MMLQGIGICYYLTNQNFRNNAFLEVTETLLRLALRGLLLLVWIL